MLSLGSLAFAVPWVLISLAGLPVIWWLIRIMPPSPKAIRFPAIRLLYGLRPREETPARTPIWLLLLRMAIAAAIIIGIAHPLFRAGQILPGPGPLILVIDNSWAAAPDWASRRAFGHSVIDEAERDGRPVALIATAPGSASAEATGLMGQTAARTALDALEPMPWPADRQAVLAAVEALAALPALADGGHAVWLSDGIAGPGVEALMERLQRFGSLTVGVNPTGAPPLLVPERDRQASGGEGNIEAVLRRADPAEELVYEVRALAGDGRLLGRADVILPAGEATGRQAIDLPLRLANEVDRLAVHGVDSAGAVALLDDRWQRRPVGLIADSAYEVDQPLLDALFYLERALEPGSVPQIGPTEQLLASEMTALIMPDSTVLDSDARRLLNGWIEKGGVLVRFAGPQIAENNDNLVPVPLRRGDRILGGALSWTQPARLAPFAEDSPFNGLSVPEDVVVRRQVLAQPSLDLDEKTWARLEDGTPIVTAEARGDGWLVLIHSSADSSWSTLAFSGLFVEMLQRLVELGEGIAGPPGSVPLAPIASLDGYGNRVTPPATARALDPTQPVTIGPATPPGLYGDGDVRHAVNLGAAIDDLRALPPVPSGVSVIGYALAEELDLRPWFLTLALLLALADTLIALGLRGLLPLPRRAGGAAAALLLAVIVLAAAPASANDADAIRATEETRLAYVMTGDPEIDEISRAGLDGLGRMLTRRTAVEVSDPMGVDIQTDELAFFPLLYWPVTPSQEPLSNAAMDRLNDFLRFGGTILFDTRDAGDLIAYPGASQSQALMRHLFSDLAVPPLVPVPPDHVLTKAFYLMQDFPGRHVGGSVWVARDETGDEVSPVIIGGNDWASAWAIDPAGRPMLPVAPGGERQREMAYRFGINVVMYALTGNYKADQVHVPSILERLGQ